MRYIIEKKYVSFDKQDVIGEGGEALIFRLGRDLAVKIYRDPTAKRARKLRDFFRAGFSLPDNVASPIEPVYDDKNQMVGFTMRRMPAGFSPIALLASRNFCDNNGIAAKDIVNMFIKGHKTLIKIHKENIIVGDINDQNELVHPEKHIDYWIDVDSCQFGAYPCMVATEPYLHPDLYNVDLSLKPMFKQEHDWYSFVVLLFRSLLRVHPFRVGTHPKFKSLMACAKNKVTVLDPNITYPKVGLPQDILTDEFKDLLLEYLKREQVGEFPIDKLEAYGDILVECPACSIWYPGTLGSCPGCSTKNLVDMRLAAKIAGCACEDLIVTQGKITFFKMFGTTAYCLADENNTTVLYKKSKGHSVVRKELFNTRHGARYNFFEDKLVVCPDPVAEKLILYILDVSGASPRPILETTTEKLAGRGAVFGCTENHLYRISGTMLMRGEMFGDKNLVDREVSQALPEQTWFTVSPNSLKGKEYVLGFYRLFGEHKWFLVVCDEKNKFQRFDVPLEELVKGESMIDLSVRFSGSSILVLRKTRSRGVDFVRVDIINTQNGSVSDSYRVKTSEVEVFENIHGKAYKSGLILHPTDQGIVQETLPDQNRKEINATSNYVQGDDKLHLSPDGIVIVTGERVILLHLKYK